MCDGFTSSSILWLYIKTIFPNAILSFTLHEHKQHGLDDKIDWIEDQNFDLVLCPDAASYDVEEHKRLGELGIDCICLDHHLQVYDSDGNPIISTEPRTIVVNNQLSPRYLNKSLCGAGVVYKFCEVLDSLIGINLAYDFIDLVALGEIADVMERTTSETNYIMVEGLKHIKNKGFQTLIESQSYSLKDKAIFPYKNLTPIDIAFYIAPLINSITRMGSMAEKESLFYCFIEPDKKMPSTKRGAKPGDYELAAEQAARLGKNAKSRQDKAKEKAMSLIEFKIQKNNLDENNIIIIELEPEDQVQQELSGLIAMAVVNKYNKPCLILRQNEDGLLQGSARNNGNFVDLPDLKQFLTDCGYFEYVSGHNNAFGAGLYYKNLPSFLSFFNNNFSKESFENCYIVDYVCDAREDNIKLFYALAEHPEYFGNHIDEVRVIVKNIGLNNIMIMGSNKDSIKISFNGIDYIHFKDLNFVEEITLNRNKTLTIYGRLNLNNFMGKTNVQCFIDDYEFVSNNYKYDF